MVIKISSPLDEEEVKKLKLGDVVAVSGTIYTMRDAVHRGLMNEELKLPADIRNHIIYHCGPIVIKEGNKWIVKAAGPTTSSRQEPYEYDLIKTCGIRGIIGKGGMGPKTIKACHEFGCVYLHTVGGAAQVLAKSITNVKDVFFYKELGGPEAVWELEVKDLPAVVTIDSHGHSLHKEVFEKSEAALKKLLGSR